MREYKKISKGQISALQIMAAKIFADKAERVEWLKRNYSQESFTGLNMFEAHKIITDWSKGLNISIGSPKSGGRPSAAPSSKVKFVGKGVRGEQKRLTEPQAERIGLLAGLLKWTPATIGKFIYNQINRNSGYKIYKTAEMLMNYEAVKVIVGMEKVASSNLGVEFLELNRMGNSELKELLKKNNDKRVENGN